MSGEPVLLVRDLDRDGTADCLLKVPAWFFSKKGFTADPEAPGCSGGEIRPMPEELRGELTELLRLRTELRAQRGEILDLDGDGLADCIGLGSTRFQAAGYDCPEPLQGVRPLHGPMRETASLALGLEIRIRERISF